MSSEMKPNIAVGLKNGAFLFIYGFCVLMLSDLIRGCTKRSESPTETAWSVVTPLDADAQFTVYRNTFVGLVDGPEAASQPTKTRLAPDGVNTITENHDGTESMTLVHVPKPDIAPAFDRSLLADAANGLPQYGTIEDAAKQQGKHVITQAEAEEVMKVMDSGAAVWQMLAELAAERGNADLAKQCRAHEAYYGTALAKWRKRVEEGKP